MYTTRLQERDDVGDVGQNVRGLTGDKDWTDGDERKDEFLRTVGRLIKPSARKRHIIGREKKTEFIGEST
jgi:hypothetical protein